MSEQAKCLCPEEDGPYEYDPDGGWPANYCAFCRCELGVDKQGRPTVTPMLPAVPADAVRGTLLWYYLCQALADRRAWSWKDVQVADALGLLSSDGAASEQARVLYAALCQAADPAAMLPVAPAEAVRATRLWQHLDALADKPRVETIGADAMGTDVLGYWSCNGSRTLRLTKWSAPHEVTSELTAEGRLIHAALAQAADPGAMVPRGALEWLAEQFARAIDSTDTECSLCPLWTASDACGGEKEPGEGSVWTCAYNLAAAAQAAAGVVPADPAAMVPRAALEWLAKACAQQQNYARSDTTRAASDERLAEWSRTWLEDALEFGGETSAAQPAGDAPPHQQTLGGYCEDN